MINSNFEEKHTQQKGRNMQMSENQTQLRETVTHSTFPSYALTDVEPTILLNKHTQLKYIKKRQKPCR